MTRMSSSGLDLLDLGDQLGAGDVGQADVEQQHVVGRARAGLDHRLALVHDLDPMVPELEDVDQRGAKRLVVVGEQDLAGAGAPVGAVVFPP